MVNVDVELDCKGMYCPMPIVKLKKATKTMESGQVLRVVATDLGATRDIPAWAKKTGAEILENSGQRRVRVYNQGEIKNE